MQVFGTLYMNEGLDKQLAVDRAVKVFSDLDVDGDGDITEVRLTYKHICTLTDPKKLHYS